MRIALALCVVVGCAMCGNALSASARRRAKTLASLAEGLRMLRARMLGMLEGVYAALTGSECPVLKKVGEAMKPGGSAGAAWADVKRKEAQRGGCLDALDAGDLLPLDSLFQMLGESGREQQEQRISAAVAAIDRRLEQAEAAARQGERLYLSLGTLIGLMLALIVI